LESNAAFYTAPTTSLQSRSIKVGWASFDFRKSKAKQSLCCPFSRRSFTLSSWVLWTLPKVS